jgi:hypothetical protein
MPFAAAAVVVAVGQHSLARMDRMVIERNAEAMESSYTHIDPGPFLSIRAQG